MHDRPGQVAYATTAEVHILRMPRLLRRFLSTLGPRGDPSQQNP